MPGDPPADDAPRMTYTNGNGNGNGHGDAAATLTAQVAAAERFARAIVVAFGVCDEVRAPLSDVQKIAVIQAALLEFDGFEAKLTSLSAIGDLLRELHWSAEES
jgi:hypothetical protein